MIVRCKLTIDFHSEVKMWLGSEVGEEFEKFTRLDRCIMSVLVYAFHFNKLYCVFLWLLN